MSLPRIGVVWWILLLLALAARSWAAPLTEAQLQVLKTDILAHTWPDPGNTAAIAAAYNVQATPDFWAWRTNLSEYVVVSRPSPTGSQWDWALFKALTVSEQNTWTKMFRGEGGSTDYSLANIRAGVAELFKGSPANIDQKNHVDAHGRRLVSRAEKLYATGTGSPAAPGLLGWEGTLTYTDVSNALALP